MTFSFGFESDDIEEDAENSEEENVQADIMVVGGEGSQRELLAPSLHTLDEMVRRLPFLCGPKDL